MAEINYRKRGSKWEYRFEAAKVDGKRRHISKGGFNSKKDAAIAGAKAYEEYFTCGNTFEPSEMSVSDYLDKYIELYVEQELAYNTQEYYKQVFKNHIRPNFGHYMLKSLSPKLMQEFANSMKTSGFAASHAKNIFAMWSSALDYAVHPLQYIKQNPCSFVRIPNYDNRKRERIILTKDEFSKIIGRFPEGSRFYIPLMIGYYTGVRISECFGLTWDDIDFENRTISVNKQMSKRKYNNQNRWFYSDKLKTRKSKRVIPFGDTLYNALKAEQNRQLRNELYYGKLYKVTYQSKSSEGLVMLFQYTKELAMPHKRVKPICVSENGELTTTDSFKYCCRVVHHNLQLAFDYHCLRHTHATMLIEAGAPIKSVSERLGHARIETTLNTYVHNTEEMATETADIFEKVAR